MKDFIELLFALAYAVLMGWLMWPVSSIYYCDRFGWWCEYISPLVSK